MPIVPEEMQNMGNENMLLEMAEHYKQIYTRLSVENRELKTILMMCYTLFRLQADPDMDWEVGDMGLEFTKNMIDKYIYNDDTI